ncbi:MAG: hypothetical protein ABI970_24930, partial [Chloroflexota bacterium]
MVTYGCCGPELAGSALKMDVLGSWLDTDWIPDHAQQNPIMLLSPQYIFDLSVLAKFVPDFALAEDYRFVDITPVDCPVALRMNDLDYFGRVTHQTGANIYVFARGEERVEVMVVASYYTDEVNCWRMTCLAAVPEAFIPVWFSFSEECKRLSEALEATDKVIVIGGKSESFVPKVHWDEIVLPDKLKHDLMEDVSSFFTKGVDVYRRLNLKPFRKLLLAGVPGTG